MIFGILVGLLSGCAGLQDFDIALGEDYYINRISSHVITINETREAHSTVMYEVIPSEVLEVGFNDDFIIAKQLAEKENVSYVSYVFHYWIINKNERIVIGPLQEQDFNKQLETQQIKIPLYTINQLRSMSLKE